MENASKALIIAGAILLAILLISLGIMIFSQAQDTVSNSGMSDADISTFNNRFLKYEGNQKGAVVKSLIQEIIASNSDDDNKSSNRIIDIKFISVTGGTQKTEEYKGIPGNGEKGIVSSIVNTSKSYEVKISEYSSKGCISKITITEQ